MKVTEKDVEYVAELANLELGNEEKLRLQRDLNAILGYIDMLNELDTSGIEPLAQVSERYATYGEGSERVTYAMRADENRPSLEREAAMKNAPETDGAHFKVPKVIER